MDFPKCCTLIYKISGISKNSFNKIRVNRCLGDASTSRSYVHISRKSSSVQELANEEVKQNQSGSSNSDEQEDKRSSSERRPYYNIFPWKSRHEFHKALLELIVHNGDGLVTINKPFGVGVRRQTGERSQLYGTEFRGKEHHSFQGFHLRGIGTTNYTLQEAVPFLRTALEKPDLVLVKSTERMTSGIAVFAENEKEADKFKTKLKISKALSHIDPLYKYHVITAAIPFTNENSFQERVGILLKSSPLMDLKQPALEREFTKSRMERGEVTPVHVKVNILSRNTNNKTALLEIGTSSIKWNFIRVYCADILTPILGDHLYSSRVKHIMGIPAKIDPTHTAPGSSSQKLSFNQLNDLELKGPEECIIVPPHIHLHSYTLHNYLGKGKHLKLETPTYPEFFKWTCDKLQLYY